MLKESSIRVRLTGRLTTDGKSFQLSNGQGQLLKVKFTTDAIRAMSVPSTSDVHVFGNLCFEGDEMTPVLKVHGNDPIVSA